MEIIQNIIEYYDELYPISQEQKDFYKDLISRYNEPAKLLRVGCGTGLFEHLLAREGKDVTGIDHYPEMLRSANLRRRNQLMSIRFFQMSYLDMARFLGKGFYNIISVLDNRIIFIHDTTLLRKFFFDCKQLLSDGGSVVLDLSNFKIYSFTQKVTLPERSSLRVKLNSTISLRDDGKYVFSQNLENGSGKILPVMEDDLVYPLTDSQIEEFAKEAGFSRIEFYSSWKKEPFTGSEPSLKCVIS